MRGVLAVVFVLLAPVTAAKAATTFGVPLDTAPTSALGCVGGGECTQAQSHPPSGERALSDGVVVRWRLRVNANVPTGVRLRIIADEAPASCGASGVYPTLAAQSTGPVETVAPNDTNEYPVRLPIRMGQFLGVDVVPPGSLGAVYFRSGPSIGTWAPPFVDNDPGRCADYNSNGRDLAVNADVEPDADLDGYGDETQDPCPDEGTTYDPCADVVAPVVRLTGLPRGGHCARRPFWIRVRVAERHSVRRVVVRRDGRQIARTALRSFRVRIRADRLHAGRHAISVRALDGSGNVGTLAGAFARCRPR